MTDFSTLPDSSSEVADYLTSVLGQMGGVLLSVSTVETVVQLVTTLAVETIADTMGAGVTLIDSRGKRTTAASDPLVERADEVQYRMDAGPCLTAWRDQVAINIADVHGEKRWPEWSSAVGMLGVRAMLSVPMAAGGLSVGAIKVYSATPAAYDGRAERVLTLFARQAAILLANTQELSDARQLSGQLTEALQNRDVIGQAKGVLLAQGAADDAAAFAMLVAASQRSNIKVHEVARQLVSGVVSRNARRST